MAAPKGNKNGEFFGRPPNPGFSDAEVIEIGEEMLDWMWQCDNNRKCDVVHLSEFYSEIKNISRTQWNSLVTNRSCFKDYYEKAQLWIGKRLLKNKDLAPSYGNRFLPIYFKEVDEFEESKERRQIDYEYEKKSDLERKKGIPENDPSIEIAQSLMIENQQLKKQLDELKSKANTELPRS